MAGLEPALDAQSARVEHSGGACGACMTWGGVGAGGQCQAASCRRTLSIPPDSPFAPRNFRNGKALNPHTRVARGGLAPPRVASSCLVFYVPDLCGVPSRLSRDAVAWFLPVGGAGHRNLRHMLATPSSPARTRCPPPLIGGLVSLFSSRYNVVGGLLIDPLVRSHRDLVPGAGVEPVLHHRAIRACDAWQSW